MKVINEVELACELAHQATITEFIEFNSDYYPTEESLYEIAENGDKHYLEEVQDVFNEYYGLYLELIDNCEEPTVLN